MIIKRFRAGLRFIVCMQGLVQASSIATRTDHPSPPAKQSLKPDSLLPYFLRVVVSAMTQITAARHCTKSLHEIS